jgi:hypothetical protein
MSYVAPGYNQLKRIDEEVPRLNRMQRTSFAAACAARTEPILFNYFGQETKPLFARALELCWLHASGEELDSGEVSAILERCEALVAELYEDDETGSTLGALNAVIFALESTRQPESKMAADAALQAQYAARGDAADQTDSDARLLEEANWQMRALDLVSRAEQPKPAMFASIDAEPEWLRAYKRESWVRG